MKTNDNQYTIYIRSTGESIPVSKEEFDNYYRDITRYRQKQQEHGRCVCPRSRWLTCDMDCLTCPFHRAGDERSLDYKNTADDGSEEAWIDMLPDENPLIEEIITEAAEAKELYCRLCELMPEAIEIGRLRLSGMTDTAISREIGIANTTFRSRIQKVKKVLAEEYPDFF